MIEVKILTNTNYIDRFLNDPQSDFLLVYGEKVFPLHSQIMDQIPYMHKKIYQKQRVHVMPVDENKFKFRSMGQIMKNILALAYGHALQLNRMGEISSYISILSLLQFDQPIKIIVDDIFNNFDEYSVFSVLTIAEILGDIRLRNRCFESLQRQQYEQMNYNLLDLLECDKKIFGQILKQHEKEKMNTNTGLSEKQIEKIKKLYCQHHSIEESELKEVQDSVQTILSENKNICESLENIPIIRVKSPLQRNSSLQTQQILPLQFSKAKSSGSSEPSKNINLNFGGSLTIREKIQKLKLENQINLKKSQSLSEELEEIKSTFSSKSESQKNSLKFEALEQKLVAFQNASKKQDEKISSFKNIFETEERKIKSCQFSPSQTNSFEQSSHIVSNFLQIPKINQHRRTGSGSFLSSKIPILKHSHELQFQ